MNNDDDSVLRRALSEWRVDAALPPGFRERVWRRIERAEGRRNAPSGWAGRLAALIARPAVSVAVAAILLAGGLLIGLARGDRDAARWEAELAHSYMASINPYVAVDP